MTAEIICVGTEILLGNIVNTNSAFIARKLSEIGVSCYHQSVVGDNAARLKAQLSQSLERSDCIILSGGLGPTQDDMTKTAVAELLGLKLYMDEGWKKSIEDFFKKRNLELTENNYRMCLVPEGAKLLDNANGQAPGIIIEKDKKVIIMLPGPPVELEPMFETSVVPYLSNKEPFTLYSSMVKLCGIGESKAESVIADLIEAQDNPTIATYAKPGEVHIRVTARAASEKEAKKLVKPVVKELKNRFLEKIYTTEDEISLEKSVVDLLLANNLTISTAESCTGGLLSARLVNVPGVSESFKTGLVTYSNKAKRRMLGVKGRTLDKFGAVSENTAKEMAKGVAAVSKSDVSVSVTGIAGPDGGSPEKPVGLVYVGVNIKGDIKVKEFRFSGSRDKIRESAVVGALTFVRTRVLEYYSKVTFGK